jgi:putative PIN family toxin of toxin-antitoxin system
VTERLRAVLDTNVFVSALLSRNPTSPTQELIRRWLNGEFTLLVCDALIDEVIEKLTEREIDRERIIELVQLLDQLAEWVDVPTEAVPRVVQADPDDDVILACAILGRADYLVTYDPHFDSPGEYQGVKIAKALPFLWTLRGSQSSEQAH